MLAGCTTDGTRAGLETAGPSAGHLAFDPQTTAATTHASSLGTQGSREVEPKAQTASMRVEQAELHRVSIDGMTLSDAVGVAISRHPSISQANAIVAQSSSDVAIARSAWYPTLEYALRPGYGRSYGDSGRRAGLGGTVGVDQLIYDFGRAPNAISAAEATLEEKRHLLDDTIESVAYSTASIVIELAASQETVTAAQRQVTALQNTRDKISERVKAGLSDASDQNLADAAILRAEAEILKARTRVDVATGKLAELIGLRPKRMASLSTMQNFVSRLGAGGGDIEATPAVQAANAAMNAAAARVRVAEAERWPQIKAGLSHSASTGSHNSDDNTFVGVTIDGNFSFGGLARNKIAAAEAERSAATHSFEDQRLAARTALGSAELEASGAAARLVSYEKVIAIMKTQRELSWQEYTLNKRPLTDVINAEREIYLAEVERTDAVADGLVARVRAYTAVGRFVALLRRARER